MIVLPPGKSTAEPDYRQFMEYDPTESCFLCHKYLCGPAIIEWSGRTTIYLHIERAVHLVMALGHDVTEAKTKYGVRIETQVEPYRRHPMPLPRIG
jgi:hypothetical protein